VAIEARLSSRLRHRAGGMGAVGIESLVPHRWHAQLALSRWCPGLLVPASRVSDATSGSGRD